MDHKVTEHFISLALNPKSGRYLVLGNFLRYGVIGAILMDLSLANKISLEGHKIKAGNDISTTGIKPYDRIIEIISESGREKNLKKWLQKLNRRSGSYRREIQKYFVREGILREEKKKFIGIPYRLHYPARPGFRKNLISRYKEIILYNKKPEDYEIMLLGLMYACKMHKVLSGGGPERRKIRKKLVEINKENIFASDINKAIMEMQAAITASIAATAAVSAATASSN
ncbi:MAG: GPP34 family phosphoprotein [Bacteroidales bacterium]